VKSTHYPPNILSEPARGSGVGVPVIMLQPALNSRGLSLSGESIELFSGSLMHNQKSAKLINQAQEPLSSGHEGTGCETLLRFVPI
jgi:hypothetical protein